jgi:D-ribose pyranose/furanose isomerase RbsD
VYIGKTPTVGNFQVCDAISVVNGQAAYTLQVGGVNVAPESANHMLVSLNGILQKPGSSFTISGSTMTFASNLATGDVIDFVQILGNVLDIGQPSDDTVTAAKLNNDIISGTTALTSEPASTDELLISDAGTLKRIDYSLITNTPAFQATTSGSTTMANQTATKIAFASEVFDTDSAYDTSNSRFTPQTAGKYAITANIRFNSSTDFNDNILRIYKNGSSVVQHQQSNYHYESNTITSIITLNGSSDYVEIYGYHNAGGNVDNESDTAHSLFQGYRIIGA